MLDGENGAENQVENEIEEEIVEDLAGGEAEGTGAGGENKEQSLREGLMAAMEASRNKDTAEEGADKGKKVLVKDPVTGKFVKTAEPKKAPLDPVKKALDGKQAVASVTPPLQPLAPQPHAKMNKTLREAWGTLPAPIQQALNQRETEIDTVLTRQDGERQLGRGFSETVAPYLASMRAENTEPLKAVAELLNTAYILRTASPQEKGRLLWRTAQTFGADMRQNMQQGQQQFDPRLNAVNQQLAELQGELKKQEALRQQQEQAGINSLIETFKADKEAHPYFDEVREDMAALLAGNRAKSLDEAYDKAVYANPDIRSALLATKVVDEEGKRVADQKAKAEKAKKAGSSVKGGGPGLEASRKSQVGDRSLREELTANLRAASS